MARVVLAMSGGVDSSVSAYLLRQQGHEVIGLFMRTGAHSDEADARPDRKKGCCSAVDAGDARRVADRLDIPFYALDFERDFDGIIDYFADEYLAGRTPNPCVVCNSWLKFGRLWTYARQLEADCIATGHYARSSAETVRSSFTAPSTTTRTSRTSCTVCAARYCLACSSR
jgi:tRNA-specific 2-thiouridylase